MFSYCFDELCFQITVLYCVPAVITGMTKSPLVSQYDLSSIQRVICGGAPLSRETELQFKQVIGAGTIQQGIIIGHLCML